MEGQKLEKRFDAAREAYAITKGEYAAAREAYKRGEPVIWSKVSPTGSIETIFHTMGLAVTYPENWGAYCAVKRVAIPFLEHCEADGFINTICGYGRNTMGYARRMSELGEMPPDSPGGGMERPTLLIGMPYGCDAGLKMWQTFRRWFPDVPFWSMELIAPPVGVDLEEVRDHYIDYLAQDMRNLVDWLERQTRRKMDLDKLSEHVAISEETWRLWYECCDLRRAAPCPMAARDNWSACVSTGIIYSDLKATLDLFKRLYNELRNRVDNRIGIIPQEKYRYLWVGLPPWHCLETLDYFESLGAVCAIDSWFYNPGPPAPIPLEVTDPYKRLAWKFFYFWAKSHVRARGETEHWMAQQYVDWVKDYKCDGAVIHAVGSCRSFHVSGIHVKEMLLKFAEIPSLVIDGDVVDPRAYNLAEVKRQADAFVETMESYRGIRKREGLG